MLFKKTLKVALATALWMVALVGANSAMAQINLTPGATDTPSIPSVYSKENLSAMLTGVAGFYGVAATGSELQTTAMLGAAGILTDDGAIWIRYDVNDNLKLHGTAPTMTITGGGAGDAYNEASFATDGYLVYRYNAPSPPAAPTTTATVDFNGNLATNGMGDGTVRVRAFASGVDAIAGDSAGQGLDATGVVVKVANSVSVKALPKTQTATVISGFKQFAVGSRVPLGGFEITLAATHKDQAGATVAADDMANFNINAAMSGTRFSGDGGFGFAANDKWTLEQVDAATGMCNGGRDVDDSGAVDEADTTGANAGNAVHPVRFGAENVNYPGGPAAGGVALLPWYLCATVAADNEEAIVASSYSLTMTFTPTNATATFPPMGIMDAPMGTVRRDGTTVDIPYLSSYEGYVHRLVIVNRNKADVGFTLTFVLEDEGTASVMSYDGMAAGGQVTTVKVGEIVTFAGGKTRGAATLTIVSSPANVDVATNLVSSDGSTDTVVLHQGR